MSMALLWASLTGQLFQVSLMMNDLATICRRLFQLNTSQTIVLSLPCADDSYGRTGQRTSSLGPVTLLLVLLAF